MNDFFNPLISTFNHYYNIFSFEYENLLEKQVNELKELRIEVHETLPDSLKTTCNKLVYLLVKAATDVTNGEMVEQCRSYFKIVDAPQIKAIHDSTEAFHNIKIPAIIHTNFSQAIYDEKKCRVLCNELNASELDFSRLFIDSKNTLELVNEAIVVRRVVLSLLAFGLAVAAYKSFKKTHKHQAAVLAGAAAITTITSIFFTGTIQNQVDFH